MTVKKRPAHTPLPAIPLSELRMMKALLARVPTNENSKTNIRALRLTIIDKLQVLALRRPHALIILAEVLDELLGQHLRLSDEHLDSQAEDQSLTDRTVGRARHHRR